MSDTPDNNVTKFNSDGDSSWVPASPPMFGRLQPLGHSSSIILRAPITLIVNTIGPHVKKILKDLRKLRVTRPKEWISAPSIAPGLTSQVSCQ